MTKNIIKKLFIIFSIFTLVFSLTGCSNNGMNIDIGDMMKTILPSLIKVDKNGSVSTNCQEIDAKWNQYKQIFNRLQSSNDIPEISTYIKNLEENQDFYKKYLSGDSSATSGESANQLINNIVWIQSPTNLMRLYNSFSVLVDAKNTMKNVKQRTKGSTSAFTNVSGIGGMIYSANLLDFSYSKYFKEDIPTTYMEQYISEMNAFLKSGSIKLQNTEIKPNQVFEKLNDSDKGDGDIPVDTYWFLAKGNRFKISDFKIAGKTFTQGKENNDDKYDSNFKYTWTSGWVAEKDEFNEPDDIKNVDKKITEFLDKCAGLGRYAFAIKNREVQHSTPASGDPQKQLVITIDVHLVNSLHYNPYLWGNDVKMLGDNPAGDAHSKHSALISLIGSGVDSVNLLEDDNINLAQQSNLVGAPTAQTNITNTGTGDSLIGTDVLVINYAYSNQSGALQEFRNNLRDYNEIADNSDGTVTSANKKKIGTAISNSAILESQNEKLKTNDLYLSTKEFSPNSHFTIDGILEDLINNTYANPNKNLGTDFYIRFANIPIACLRLNEINPNAQRELQKSQEEAETQGYHTIYTEQGNQAIKTWCVIDIVSQIGTNGFTSVPADDGNGTYVYDFFDDTFHKVSDVNNVNSDVMTITQEQQDELRKTYDTGQSFYCADTGHILLIQYYPLYTNGEDDVRYPIGRKLYLNKDNMRYDGGNNYLWLTPATKPFAYLSEPVNNLYSNQIGLNLGAIIDVGSGQQIPGWENAVGGTSNSRENMSLTPVYRLP